MDHLQPFETAIEEKINYDVTISGYGIIFKNLPRDSDYDYYCVFDSTL